MTEPAHAVRLPEALFETDVHLGSVHGNDVVYRPEIVFLRADRWTGALAANRIIGAFVAVEPNGDGFASRAVPGLDLPPIRGLF